MQNRLTEAVICIVGLGYVGLPLAEAFSRHFRVIGFDTNTKLTGELGLHGSHKKLAITSSPRRIKQADFVIITVPTPVTRSKEPDLSCIESASRIVSRNLKAGCTVILESTVYPGVTEEVMRPILEESGLSCGQGFKIAYSPERINPGDSEHTIDKMVKIVSGMDEDTAGLVAELYGRICPEIFKAKDIKTAEAAKVIENIQRDLNIALVNELCLIFTRMGLTTKDVLAAAATKWNFHRYSPGLVGGHCIPVDPYYLVYKAKELDYHPQVILAGRAINDYMPRHVAEIAIKALNDVGKVIRGSRVLIMGLTYKENVADTRESPLKEIIKELKEFGVDLYGHDPLLDNIENEFDIKALSTLKDASGIDCVILAVEHDAYRKVTLAELSRVMGERPILIDVRGFFSEKEAVSRGFYYRTL